MHKKITIPVYWIFIALFSIVLASWGTLNITSNPKVCVSATKMNVLYKGMQNPISIAASDISLDVLKVEYEGGEIDSAGKGYYILKPDFDTRLGKIKVYQRNNSEDLIDLGTFEFRHKELPLPNVRLAGIKCYDSIPRRRLVQAPIVSAELANFEFEGVKFRVSRFDIRLLGDTLDRVIQYRGNKLGPIAVELIRSKDAVKQVELLNIRARLLGANTVDEMNLDPCSFYIKD